jgi:TRAP-type C4-dicarboxylate transport system permease small subunit
MTMRAMALRLDRIAAALNAVAIWGAILAILVMIGAAGWQVIARYALSQPPVWTEELARFSMVWAGVLGGSCAFRALADPTLFPDMREKVGGVGGVLAILRALGAFVFIAPILWYSVFGLNGQIAAGYVGRLMGRQAETMPVPMAAFGIAIPVAFMLILIHLLADLCMTLTGQKRATP